MRDKNQERADHFSLVYERAQFRGWQAYLLGAMRLANNVIAQLAENVPEMKLVGSSSTGTMRAGGNDYDFAVAFPGGRDDQAFVDKLEYVEGLVIRKIVINRQYGYLKACGLFDDETECVFVPMDHPMGRITSYEQDAFYHPDFINSRRTPNHALTTIILKEFFTQLGFYEQVKGIGCEILSLRFKEVDQILQAFVDNQTLRINYSQDSSTYSDAPLVIDYPYLGGRSFTSGVTNAMYSEIQNSAARLLEDPTILIPREDQ